MASIPHIPDIQVPQSQAPQQSQALDNTISQLSQIATSPLPSQYSQGTQIAQPRQLPTIQQPGSFQRVVPTGGTATEKQMANTAGGIGAIAHLVTQGVQAIRQKKQDQLKTRLVDVMQAKQNVANAQQVLQQDPNNKMAQGVMQANKQRLNDILSDPKHAKEMQKALDISFTDADKNKTPEVQAFQQAHKEVQQAGQYNAANPQEAQVAKLAQGGAVPAAQVHAGPPNPNAQPRSTTPYADKALAKDLPTIQQNPQYAAAMQQQQAAQKALWTNVIPKAIQAQVDMQKTQLQQDSANARAKYVGEITEWKTQTARIDKMDELDQSSKNALKLEEKRFLHSKIELGMRIDAMKEIAANKLNDPKQKQQMGERAIGEIDASIQKMAAVGANLRTLLSTADDTTKPTLQAQLDANDRNMKDTQEYRTKTAESFYGMGQGNRPTTSQAPAAKQEDLTHVLGMPVGIFGIGPKNVGSNGSASTQQQSLASPESVGGDQSDESDPEDDSTINSLINE